MSQHRCGKGFSRALQLSSSMGWVCRTTTSVSFLAGENETATRSGWESWVLRAPSVSQTLRESKEVYRLRRMQAQGQKQGYLPRKKQENSPPAGSAGSQPLSASNLGPYAGSHARRWPPRQRGHLYVPRPQNVPVPW